MTKREIIYNTLIYRDYKSAKMVLDKYKTEGYINEYVVNHFNCDITVKFEENGIEQSVTV